MSKTPTELGKLFERIAKPDAQGISQVILIKDLIKYSPDFETTNGCSWARSHTSYLGKKYIIKRSKLGNKVHSIQLIGFNTDPEKHNIPQNVRNYFKDKPSCFSGSQQDLQIDHKNGKYNDEDPNDINNYQILTRQENDIKRQYCKSCKNTGKRFDAKSLGFGISWTAGDEKSSSCIGCFWNDIKDFRQKVSITS